MLLIDSLFYINLFGINVVHLLDTRFRPPYHLRALFRVRDKSILRKVFPIKEKNPKAKNAFCFDYFRMIPVFSSFLLSSVFFIMGIIDLFLGNKLLLLIGEKNIIRLILFSYLFDLTYMVIIIIWWEIADRNNPDYERFKKLSEIKEKEKQKNNNEKDEKEN